MEAVTLAETIKSAISLLPSKNSISLANKDDIESIRKMYDGLNDYQKKFVSKDSWKKFEELEARLKELIKANESADGSDKTDKSDKADGTDKTDSTGKTDSTDKTDSTGKTDSTDKSDSTDKTEETGSAGSGDTTDNSSDRTE